MECKSATTLTVKIVNDGEIWYVDVRDYCINSHVAVRTERSSGTYRELPIEQNGRFWRTFSMGQNGTAIEKVVTLKPPPRRRVCVGVRRDAYIW
jgi:hypothetical protein